MRKIPIIIFIISLLFINIRLYALDTDVFMGGVSGVQPNILIILDTSASMVDANLLVHSRQYNLAATYTPKKIGSVTPVQGSVYYSKNSFKETEKMLLEKVTDSLDNIICTEAHDSLRDAGVYVGKLATLSNAQGKFDCDASESKVFYDGNYLNYLSATDIADDTSEIRQTVARRAIRNLVNATGSNVGRFGLMRYEAVKDDGGNIVLPVGSTAAQFNAKLDDTSSSADLKSVGTTPLAESLAEAGLYYAGRPRWSNYQTIYSTDAFISGSTSIYKSPIQYRCQKNYVVLITDGMSTNDMGSPSGGNNGAGYDLFLDNNYINNKAIGDYDDDKQDLVSGVVKDLAPDAGTTHMLDDVAKFLFDEDLINSGTDLGGGSYETDSDFEKQNVQTYTIGFMTGSGNETLSQIDDLLLETAKKGVGEFLPANNSDELQKALLYVVGKIMEANSSFVAPVVPVNKLNKVYSGNSVYLSLFKPVDRSAFWLGNIKKFGITSNAVLLQKDGSQAVDSNDTILDTATSCWQKSSSDASEADLGGAGAVILNLPANERKFYTNPSSAGALIDFYTDTSIRSEMGGTGDKAELVNFLTARGKYAFLNNTEEKTKRTWVLGDILHSKPATMFKGKDTVIFVGANDGFLHAFVDDDNDTRDDTLNTTLFDDDKLSEAWCFAPRALLPKLHNLKESTTHDAYVDGSPVIHDVGNSRYLTFGLRRGGDWYYTLNIGSLTNGEYTGGYETPSFVWGIPPSKLGGETLGQSWGRPWVSTIATGAGERKKALILPGGYDEVNEDKDTPTGNTKGRAVYAVDAATGDVITALKFSHAGGNTSLTHCIVELVAFDYNSNGVDDTIYAGSMGGELFAFSDRGETGSWTMRKVFQAPTTSPLKFFYEPDVALERFGDYVFIGTGDREHPREQTTVNRFYAIKNNWTSTTLDESHLQDVTSYNYTDQVLANLANHVTNKGWFIRLSTGEKVMSSPLLFDKKVFFTTYTPVISNSGDDLCAANMLGKGKLYALDYLTGKAAMNFNTGNDTTNNGVTNEVLDQTDRSTSLGLGIPSAPTLMVTKDGGAKLIIATGVSENDGSSDGDDGDGDIKTKVLDVKGGSSSDLFYWRQN